MESLALHSSHAALGATFQPLNEREVVESYGDPAAEYQAAHSGVGLLDFSCRDLLRLTGEERASFLHGMCTQEINGLPEGGSAYAAFLTAKGAMVGDARVLRRKTELLLDTEPGMGEPLLSFLSRFLISEDAEVSLVSEEWALLCLVGPNSESVGKVVESPEVIALPHLLPGVAGVDLLVPRGQLEQVFTRLLQAPAVKPMGFQAWQMLRVESGVPRYGEDLVETTIPLEAQLERAISYEKGCYIGQEVIARATFRGHMNRQLSGLLLGAERPEPGAELKLGEKRVGWLTSVVHSPGHQQFVALGYVHRDHREPGTRLSVGTGGQQAVVAPLPLVPYRTG